MTPTQRTLAALRKRGLRADVVERWIAIPGIPGGGKRKDYLGIIDILALDPARGVIGVQCCAGSGFSAHLKKITEEHAQDTLDWLQTPGTSLEIWAWRKLLVRRGGKAEVWTPRVQEVDLSMVAPAEPGQENDGSRSAGGRGL